MKILMTGGTGTFGKAVSQILIRQKHEVWTPPRTVLDIRKEADWHRAICIFEPEVIVHAAAYTNVEKAEIEREECYATNVLGTRLGIRAAAESDIRFLFISTDYVFDGKKGNYGVSDYIAPVNYYGFTKAMGEAIVLEHKNGAVIRTSFAPDGPWRHPRAWEDLFTGKEFVSTLAPSYALAAIIPFTGIVHIAGPRKSVLELARRTSPETQPIKRAEARFPLPFDVSLDTTSWETVKRCWSTIFRSR